jgi:hypothetical protein
MPKEKKPKAYTQQEIDDAIRDRGPFYIGARGTKSQTPSKEMYANQPEPSYYDIYGDRGRIEAAIADVDQLGNALPSQSSNMPSLTTSNFNEGGEAEITKGHDYIKDLL